MRNDYSFTDVTVPVFIPSLIFWLALNEAEMPSRMFCVRNRSKLSLSVTPLSTGALVLSVGACCGIAKRIIHAGKKVCAAAAACGIMNHPRLHRR